MSFRCLKRDQTYYYYYYQSFHSVSRNLAPQPAVRPHSQAYQETSHLFRGATD